MAPTLRPSARRARSLRTPRALIVAGAFVLLALGAVLGFRPVARPANVVAPVTHAPDSPSLTLHVPHAASPIVVDGDVSESGWIDASARTNAFVTASGALAVPHSDARFVWSGDFLYVTLYAADLDVRVHETPADGPVWLGDSFRLVFTTASDERVIEVSPAGTLTDARRSGKSAPDYAWQSGARARSEIEGKPNDLADPDEEWLVEMAVPFAALGMKGAPGEAIGVGIRRCDVSAEGPRLCGSWGEGGARGRLVLD